MPNAEACLDRLAGRKYYSVLDGFSGYYVVELTPRARDYTAFVTPFGKFRYTVMPFGITNAPPIYALLNQRTFGPLMGTEVEVFFDDCGVGSGSFEDHMSTLEKCFQCYKKAGMSLNPKKCSFLQSSIIFLGHRVSSKGLEPDPGKIEKIRSWERPTDTLGVQRFLGFVNYYRRFIKVLQSAPSLYVL